MKTTPATELDSNISEKDFQALIVEYANLRGWRCAHFRPARTKEGWRTAVSYQGHGYPDLTLVRDGEVVWLEVKSRRGQFQPGQKEWVAALPNAYVVRPADWPKIEKLLR